MFIVFFIVINYLIMKNKTLFLVMIVFVLIGISCKTKYSIMESSARLNYQLQKKNHIECCQKSIDISLEKITESKKEVTTKTIAKKETRIQKTIFKERTNEIKYDFVISKKTLKRQLKKHFYQEKKKTKDSKKTKRKKVWLWILLGILAIVLTIITFILAFFIYIIMIFSVLG